MATTTQQANINNNNRNSYAGLPPHMMAPDKDHDPRYKAMDQYVKDNNVPHEVLDVDFANNKAFISPTDKINNLLQPRVNHVQDRDEQKTMILKDLISGTGLIRPLWLYEDPDGLLVTIAGRGRQQAIQSPLNTNKNKKHSCIVLQGAALEDARQLALRSNVPSSTDITPMKQEDLVHSFQHDAIEYVRRNNLVGELKPADEAALKSYLKTEIRVIHPHYDPADSRLGVIVNKIVDTVRAKAQYLTPLPLLGDVVDRDKGINDQYQKFYPQSCWNTITPSKAVWQHVFSTETFENAKQWLDSFLEKPEHTDVYKGQKEMHITYWIKYIQGSVKRDTVKSKLESLKHNFKRMNTNHRRRVHWNIPPVRRLFFPATFAGMEARCFEWDAGLQDFREVGVVAKP